MQTRNPVSSGRKVSSIFVLVAYCNIGVRLMILNVLQKNPGELHMDAWKRFNKAVGGDGSVGIWHETYQVTASSYECVYGNMPEFGLAAASSRVPAEGAWKAARSRITRERAA